MRSVDYDVVAPAFDKRYSYRQYGNTRALLRRFLGEAAATAAVEVGCGTGHWLGEFAGTVGTLIGIDLSWGMLQRARAAVPSATLVRADAVLLPLAAVSVDRILCVNVLHHIPDAAAFLRECRRVLRPGGVFLTIGLDPHTGTDRWWVYDYFPAARVADDERYPSAERIRELLALAGLSDAATEVAEHLTGTVPFAEAYERGSVDRRASSQLMVIADDEYEAGLERLRVERPVLQTDLRLFATVAHVPQAVTE
jgi:ubiquinone/menaquinone biosynthesis C-methylase UbiE